jgi:hypothetical protein
VTAGRRQRIEVMVGIAGRKGFPPIVAPYLWLRYFVL